MGRYLLGPSETRRCYDTPDSGGGSKNVVLPSSEQHIEDEGAICAKCSGSEADGEEGSSTNIVVYCMSDTISPVVYNYVAAGRKQKTYT